MGRLYADQGKLAEAEKMCQRALRRCERPLGLGHSLTILTADQLRDIYRSQGNLAQAEKLNHLIFEGCWHALIVPHPSYELSTTQRLILSTLGRLLLRYGDEVNAQIAFQQTLVQQFDTWVYSGVLCDGCDVPLTFDTRRHVCKHCQDIDLCRHCMENIRAGALVLESCLNHDFLAVRLGFFSRANIGLHFGKSITQLWLENLLGKYLESKPFLLRKN